MNQTLNDETETFVLLLLCSEVGLEVPFKLMHAKPDAGKTANVLMFTAAVHICTTAGSLLQKSNQILR